MSEAYRKAALKLHGLGAPDRAWVLKRLPARERAELSALLRELQQLGIEPDRQLADHIGSDDVRHASLQACGTIPGFPDALDALCAALPVEMMALLEYEPDSIAAAILAAYPWPWRARLLADYGVEKRQAISGALMAAPQLKPRVRGELVNMLAGRLATLRTDRPVCDELVAGDARAGARHPGRRSRSDTLMQGLRRWLP